MRRHGSLSDRNDKERRTADSSADVVTDVLRRIEVWTPHSAIAKLKPDEQDLIHRLYLACHPWHSILAPISESIETESSIGNQFCKPSDNEWDELVSQMIHSEV